jgi:hypothetical protein
MYRGDDSLCYAFLTLNVNGLRLIDMASTMQLLRKYEEYDGFIEWIP